MHSLGAYDIAGGAGGYTHERDEGGLVVTGLQRPNLSMVILLHAAVAPGVPMAGVGTKTLLRMTVRKVHPDRYQSAGPQLFYIALASNTLIQRCMQSIDNTDIQDQRAMPRIVVTNFVPYNSAQSPRSKFEYIMAQYTETRRDCAAGDL